jgi:hypothetical protein
VVAAIRERMEPVPPLPDGPPPGAREQAANRLALAEGIDQAYAAVYRQDEPEFATVYALQYAAGSAPAAPTSEGNPLVVRVVLGSIAAMVSGRGPCFDAVASHVRSLGR